ncbi:MAG: putative esterase, partial [Bryobacterales bacterium]|nr:putative esterase [Bryobacterales bacterium]
SALTAFAQPAPAPGRAGGRGGPPAPKSPEVSTDGRVTFRLRAPNAKEVAVTGLPGGRLVLQKDEQGVWTGTTEALKPDMYGYLFSIDGANVNDPANAAFKTSATSAGQSLVHVPGAVSWEPTPGLPRGAVAHHFYHSSLIGDDRDFYVYTPPNYDPNRKEPYPVLYLLHGLGDDAYGWISAGAANVILDNLIGQGKAQPMIMVNTLGYGVPLTTMFAGGGGGRGGMGGNGMIANFAKALTDEVMPQVEKQYRVTKDRNQRAIAGLSMGGAEALYTGLNNLDKFTYVASFSGAFVMWPKPAAAASAAAPATPGPAPVTDEVFAMNFPKVDAKINSQLKLLWIGCGTEDGLIGVNRQFRTWLKSKDVKAVEVETPAMAHVWPLWRQNLTEIAPMLFQKGK